MKNKDAKLSAKTASWLVYLVRLGTQINDNLDAGIRPSKSDIKNLYDKAKNFIVAYEEQHNEGGDKP